jgi:DNA-binding transcriptional ArsR family regulator
MGGKLLFRMRVDTPLTVDIFNHMVEQLVDQVYAALAHPARREIVTRLAKRGEARVTEIASSFDVSLNAVSKHVKVLERAGLVRRRVEGREHWLHLEVGPLAKAESWIARQRQFWEESLDGLEAYVLRKRKGQSTGE